METGLSSTSSEANSKFERSFNPWLSHCRNMDWKASYDIRSPTKDKIIPSESDCMMEYNANARAASIETTLNKGVNIDLIFRYHVGIGKSLPNISSLFKYCKIILVN